MKVFGTDAAVDQLRAIHAHIERTSPAYALPVVDRLTRRTQQLEAFPMSGRRVPKSELEAVRKMIEGSYRIVYELPLERIEVLAVLHGARSIERAP